jgi:GH15 family glucan-1,4-alpha-glucosidase
MDNRQLADLREASLAVLRAGQAATGAYVASPTFSQYGYSWYRDGSWIAHAMDIAGQHASASAFHRWAARTVMQYEARIEGLLAKLDAGITPNEHDYLPTRFTLDSGLGQEEWPDFQLDGYGAWLWALVQHCRAVNPQVWDEVVPAVKLLVRYLQPQWTRPSYDCWEEFRERVHTSTLAALYGGLKAVEDFQAGIVPPGLTAGIRSFVLQRGVDASYGGLNKFISAEADEAGMVDAALLWSAVPFDLLSVDDPIFLATLARIEHELHVRGGGVYRYRGDTYFGGSEWLLLAAWLGWAYVELGRLEEARALRAWIAARATSEGHLPEQVHDHMLAPEYYDGWVQKWGTSACPLLWSHAMYMVLDDAIHKKERSS